MQNLQEIVKLTNSQCHFLLYQQDCQSRIRFVNFVVLRSNARFSDHFLYTQLVTGHATVQSAYFVVKTHDIVGKQYDFVMSNHEPKQTTCYDRLFSVK